MSLERIIKALISLGLLRLEAEMYIYIANKGQQKALNIAKALNCNKSTAYDNLKKLQTKGLVSKDKATFSALSFEEALELLINRQKKETNNFHESKKQLLATWKKKHN